MKTSETTARIEQRLYKQSSKQPHLFKPYRYSYQIVDRLPVKAGGDEVRQVADHLASNGIHLAV